MMEAKTHFYNNPGPRWIHITGLKEVGESAFENMEGLQKAHFKTTVNYLGAKAFKNTGLEEIYIPPTVNVLGENCFEGCTNLKVITIPEGVISISDKCFKSCSSLMSVLIGSNVQSLSNHCFQDCRSLVKISLPDSVMGLADSCFTGCTKLTEINFSDNIRVMGENVFFETSLVSINFPSALDVIPRNFLLNNPLLRYVHYNPKESGVISDYAFNSCGNLKYIDIMNVSEFGSFSFSNTGVNSIIFDNKVRFIKAYCFSECKNLGILIFQGKEPPIVEKNAFENKQLITVFVPKGTVKVYKESLKISGGNFKFIEM